MIKLRNSLFLSLCLAVAPMATAETVLLDEDFNADYNKSFPYWLDGDCLEPHASIAPLFYSNSLSMSVPWWIVRDRSTSTDKFLGSHSYYQTPGKSSDWLISIPLEISSAGFVLEFDAQSVNVRGANYLSDLSIYITDEMIDPDKLPTIPTYVITQVPWGNDPDNCENDWTHYSYSLDEYAGKTIYISFVNENDDKDIVCIDNVTVYRHDAAELTLSHYDAFTTEHSAKVGATALITEDSGVSQWSVDLKRDGVTVKSWQGEALTKGETIECEAEIDLTLGDATDFEFVITTDGSASLSAGGVITCLAFQPTHRVFFEETTSLHCGNCPMGIYAVETMLDDPNLGEYIVPVSVHIAGLGFDPMATPDYYSKLPDYSAAPVVFVERSRTKDGFNPSIDLSYDPTNPVSFAYRISQRIADGTSIDLKVDADWVIEGSDTVAVACKATVHPAFNIKGKDYRVAFVLTENNVGLDRNRYWVQENYLAGGDYESRAGGWCDLPSNVINARYHEVARAISAYHGHVNSLPADMDYESEYTYSYDLTIPDTEQYSNGYHMADPIKCAFCEVTAIVIDHETGMVINAARVPMSPLATKRFTAADLVSLGINDIEADDSDDSEASAVYYDLTGRRVDNPHSGIYIRYTPAKVTKVIK